LASPNNGDNNWISYRMSAEIIGWQLEILKYCDAINEIKANRIAMFCQKMAIFCRGENKCG